MLVDVVDAPPIDWSPAPPVRVVETRAPVELRRTRRRRVGRRLRAERVRLGPARPTSARPAPAPSSTTASTLGRDGDLDTSHLDSARPGRAARAVRAARRGRLGRRPGEVFEPRHTVHGFRYARITGRDGGPLDPAIARRCASCTPTCAAPATFACSDEDLNRLHEIADWSFRGNAVDVPTDCPTRERLAWTGDYQVFVADRDPAVRRATASAASGCGRCATTSSTTAGSRTSRPTGAASSTTSTTSSP